MRDINYYLNLVLGQYKQPLYLQLVEKLLEKFYLDNIVASDGTVTPQQIDADAFLQNFDIDKATGFYLDIIGNLFGVRRNYLFGSTLPAGENVYTLFDIENISTTTAHPMQLMSELDASNYVATKGRFLDKWINNIPVGDISTTRHTDSDYRILIKLAIASQTYRGAFGEIEEIISKVFPDGSVVVTDGLDGNINYTVSEGFNKILENMIRSGKYFPKSAGIGARSFLSVRGKPQNLLILYEVNDVKNTRDGTLMTDMDNVWSYVSNSIDKSRLNQGEFLEAQ